jgi:2,5-diketo-D-gluconate reductase A
MTQVTQIPTVALNDGHAIPQLGYGVFQVPPEDAERVTTLALEAGYRHIDTAAAYDNEEGVGRAIRASGLPRDAVYVTTKLWNHNHGREKAPRALDASLRRLGLDYVDLYLIHWPNPRQDRYVETWLAFEELRDAGHTRSIGVSNFTIEHLERLARETTTAPAVNQIELHPRFQQTELRAYHREHGIVTEAWSPLGQGGEILEDPTIGAIANNHGKTPAQVILGWQLEMGNVTFPKSVTPERIRENIDVFGFDLTDEEIKQIDELDRGQRLGPDPETFGER